MSTTYTGVHRQAAYRIEVPKDWNGDLVLYAHPYQGLGNVVWVDSPALRSWFVSHGYAWAASSFGGNGYDVGEGVTDTQDLLKVFASRARKKAKAVFLVGESMGGQVAAVEAEDFKGDFAGVMPYCAPLGGAGLYDYYLGANVTAAAITKVPISFSTDPSVATVLQYEVNVAALVLPRLGTGFLTPSGPKLSAEGKEWETAIRYLSGGSRPGFASAFSYWNSMSYGPLSGMPTLFDLYPGLDGGTAGVAAGNLVSNVGVTYHADASSTPTKADKALNSAVLRVRSTTSTPAGQLNGIPPVVGDP
ncbi:MAG: alpha/beta hydrolase family protein, partial [Acidimicrobiales bacterium]